MAGGYIWETVTNAARQAGEASLPSRARAPPPTLVSGGLATQAGLAIALGVAVGFDGSLYIADFARIRKVRPDGIITTVAGIGFAGFSGDGGPATQAAIEFNIRGLAVGSMAAYTSPTKGTSASDE